MDLRHLFLTASILLAAGPASGTVLGSKEIADRVSGELREQIPDYVVTESDDQTLKILKADKQLFQVNLAEIEKFCAADSIDKEMASKLIVCIVGTNLIVYGREDRPGDVAATRRFADQMKGAAGYPISTDIYRWTKTGWQIAQE